MFLKSLVVRGFKSFADKTTLVFEPGVSVVVGPNGSGKSNIVDTISWVLGEQGPRSLRGGRMEDVIFAGSRLRPALGMAEATLTIDNTARLLPIEFSEVTITRTLFRNGESEYRLNGAPCRLLDIQELLSDTGIGREQHTIIGQGQLDEILNADASQIRGFIEEAAGVAKHRRRKERALRKLAGSEQNLTRLSDLLSEVRRQLRPLRAQAEMAERYGQVAAELANVRLVLASRELSEVRSRLGPGGEDLDAPIREREEALSAMEAALTQAEVHHAEMFNRAETGRDAAWSLERAAERSIALSRLASERSRSLRAEIAAMTEASAEARLDQFRTEHEATEAALVVATAERTEADRVAGERGQAVDEARDHVTRAERSLGPARASHRELTMQALRVRGEVAAHESSIEEADREMQASVAREAENRSALGEAELSLEKARANIDQIAAAASPLEEALATLESELRRLGEARSEASQVLRAAELEAARLEGPSALSPERLAGVSGVLGTLADLVSIQPEYRRALEAVAGPPREVVVVDKAAAVPGVLESIGGPARILIAGLQVQIRDAGIVPLASFAQSKGDALRVLAGIFVARDETEASRLAGLYPNAIFVTRSGASAVGRLVARAEDLVERREQVRSLVESARQSVEEVESNLEAVTEQREETLKGLNELDAAAAAGEETLRGAERELHALGRESEALDRARLEGSASLDALRRRADGLRLTLPGIEATVAASDEEITRVQNDQARLAGDLEAAARDRDEATFRLATVSAEERLLRDRVETLETAIQTASHSLSTVGERRTAAEARAGRASMVEHQGELLGAAAKAWAIEARGEYEQIRAEVESVELRLQSLRSDRASAARELDSLRTRARDEDLGRSELKIRGRILEERMREEWGVHADEAVAKYGSQWEVEDPSRLTESLARAAAMDTDALRRKLGRLERDLAQMGAVNPLAAQEYQDLTEREEFLVGQVGDVRRSRRDLFKILSSVDQRIRELFKEAYEDVARGYERLFALLFPGGQGRLRLTDATDLLTTGVEVEARPGGKNLRRLSLLSGGERALSALALLFAVFRARPSPFYVLDEVEAALDDVNLHRFLGLIDEFRATSQLIVVTHQKRTMEVADVLYGVSIRPDGSSLVISERLDSGADSPDLHAAPVSD